MELLYIYFNYVSIEFHWIERTYPSCQAPVFFFNLASPSKVAMKIEKKTHWALEVTEGLERDRRNGTRLLGASQKYGHNRRGTFSKFCLQRTRKVSWPSGGAHTAFSIIQHVLSGKINRKYPSSAKTGERSSFPQGTEDAWPFPSTVHEPHPIILRHANVLIATSMSRKPLWHPWEKLLEKTGQDKIRPG